MATMIDWKKALAGDAVDPYDFEDFIPRDGNEDFLQEAFSSLPNGQTLINRIKQLFAENNNESFYVIPEKDNFLDEENIREMVRVYCHEISSYYKKQNNILFAKEAAQLAMEPYYDSNSFGKAIEANNSSMSEIMDDLTDEFRIYLKVLGNIRSALYEALFSLTKYNEVTWYLLEDAIGFPLKNKNYYNLWKAGGDYYICEDKILILCKKNPCSYCRETGINSILFHLCSKYLSLFLPRMGFY